MTVTTWLLLALFIATSFACVAFALPPERLNAEHPFVTDLWECEGERIGKHERRPFPECAGRRLFVPVFRYVPDQDH